MNEFRSRVLGDEPFTGSLLRKKAPRNHASGDRLANVAVPRSEGRRGNHRTRDRHRLKAERATVRHKRGSWEVELINLSGGGAMVEGPVEAKLWDLVELILGEHGTIECAVRWNRGNRFGLEFAHETTVDCDDDTLDEMLRQVIRRSFPEISGSLVARPIEEPPEEEMVQKRNATRHPLIWTGTLYHDYDWCSARIRNISAGGALVQCDMDLPEGSTVYLDLGEAGKLAATVCWAAGDQVGLSFEQPFDVRLLARRVPELAPQQWTKPEYLRDESIETSPWASRWGRLSIPELRNTLRR